MTRHNVFFAMALLGLMAAMVTLSGAQQQVTPPSPILVNSPIVTINNSAGDQTDPHVDKDVAAYTDLADGTIHYYRFSTGVDTAIPRGTLDSDTLADVSGDRICFTRETGAGDFEQVVFDVTTSSVTLVDPRPGDLRMGCAVGGNTLAYVDFGTGTGSGDIFVYDLAANPPTPPQALSLDPNQEEDPNVSPDGNTIVWENCPTGSNCDVMKAVRSGTTWMVSTVANTSAYEENPHTDGTWVAYDSNQGSTSQHVFFQPVVGGQQSYLSILGVQVNPSVSAGFIGFESTVPPNLTPDIFVYNIAYNDLYQITATPGVNEELNHVSVLDNGDIRVVWAADDGPSRELNVYATTFTPISHQISYQICSLYDSNVAKKSGAAYPIKIQLCDSAGNNMSSPSIVVHAVSVTKTSSNTPVELDDTGNANPDFDFRYDSSLMGYVFNLSTKGYATGTYMLNFTAGADPNTHSAGFAVK